MNNSIRETDEDSQGGGFFNYLPTILWQRKWLIIAPFIALSAAGLAAALLLPTIYRSSAILLVESQVLSEQVVGSPVGNLIDQRIAKIKQQVLSRGDLVDLIQQNNLYDEERKTKPISEVVERMREAVQINAVNADIGQEQGGASTIAFSVSYDYRDPVKAQLVMQSFVDSFLKLDSTDLLEQANTTVSFLQKQAEELRGQIAEIEGQITSIKTRNGTALASANMSGMSNVGSFDAQIAALQRENAIAMQQARKGTKDPGVAAAEAQLASARAIYAERHPDVVFAKQRLDQARQLAAQSPNDDARSIAAAQIAANNAQIQDLLRARAAESARSTSVSAAQARAPVVMESVTQLENRAAVLRAQFQDVSTRLLAARNSERMANEDKGERLSVIDPPQVPDRPLSPDRLLLVLGGIAAGSLAGLALALLVELVLRPIRGVKQLEQALGMPALAVIPPLSAKVERRRARAPRSQAPAPAE
jgi:uncharacterized protein involved in exopolysaccharide biosynthesis